MQSAVAHHRQLFAAGIAVMVIAAVSALAVAGWAKYGEAIFLKMADGAWLTCF